MILYIYIILCIQLQYAENLLSSVSTTCENIAHIVWVATKNIQKLKEHTDGKYLFNSKTSILYFFIF